LLFGIGAIHYKNYVDQTPILFTTKEAVSKYFYELDKFKEIADLRVDNLAKIGATVKNNNQTLVVVIGESASKHHLSSYGYPRKTSPNSDRMIKSGEMIRLNAVYSNHTHSNPTISRALTGASSYNGKDWVETPSVVNVANAAGLNTTWVSNKPMYGAWDSHMTVIGTEAQNVTHINTRIGVKRIPNQPDGAMLPLVKEGITTGKDNEVVFMHLQGSHGHYCYRYPDEFEKFTEKPKKYVYGQLLGEVNHRAHPVNCYDNSIYYTDHILNELVKYLTDVEKPSAMLYVPDHGENAMEGKGHNSAKFDFFMTEVPAFFWANDSWKKQNPQRWKAMQSNRDKVFTNDHLFELVAGLNGIDSKAVDIKNDLSSTTYQEPATPKTLHGRRNLNVSTNTSYWQRENIRRLIDQNLQQKVVAHRVNTLGKAGNILSDGLTSFEIDVHYADGKLNIGYDKDSMADVHLEQFLNELDVDVFEFKKLWLNLRSLKQNEPSDLLKHLDALDSKLDLKQRMHILVSETNEEIPLLAAAGYSLIYKIEDSLIDLSSGNTNGKLAQSIVNSARQIGASGISLDTTAYSFYKEHLAPLVEDQELSIHLRTPSGLELSTAKLLEALNRQDYFKDPEITSISLDTYSRHHL